MLSAIMLGVERKHWEGSAKLQFAMGPMGFLLNPLSTCFHPVALPRTRVGVRIMRDSSGEDLLQRAGCGLLQAYASGRAVKKPSGPTDQRRRRSRWIGRADFWLGWLVWAVCSCILNPKPQTRSPGSSQLTYVQAEKGPVKAKNEARNPQTVVLGRLGWACLYITEPVQQSQKHLSICVYVCVYIYMHICIYSYAVLVLTLL